VIYTHKTGKHSLYASDSDVCRVGLLNIYKKSRVVLDCKHNVLIHTESSKDVRTVRGPRAFPPQGAMIASTSNVLKVPLRRIWENQITQLILDVVWSGLGGSGGMHVGIVH